MTGRLQEIYESLNEGERDALWYHLSGDTSAEWIANVLTKHGHPVSATTVRTQRRAWRRAEAENDCE